ncbi:SRPBCC family protein [Corynebacterium hansenii]|uniref:SRPBCC family protein n=1 Tax=Corynebacterium hansenii TaxID=394964 RepID=A0ABV7ZMP4_9CORY|nr:SRPBCC family protein [Corynebacterium hansenii]WJZ00372.1 Polyketide cyclase / dehydrase and lipid transport [Corynebacterium hansenii]
MSDRTQGQILINAPRERILDVVGDVTAYPEWATGTTAAVVTEEGDRPLRPKRAKFTLETVLRDVYELAYEWTEDGVSWSLLSSQLQKSQSGSYSLTDAGDGATKVRYELEIVTAVPMLGLLRRKAEHRIVDTALKSLKRRVEGLSE